MALRNKPQFHQGKSVEAWLDDFFARRGWQITPTTAREERELYLGDRHYRKPGEAYRIEYKSGIQTYYTGNVFLETISVDSQGVPGWVYTCRADYIFYAALLNKQILIFEPDHLRAQIGMLKTRFKEVRTSNHQNDGYDTHGVIVPLSYAVRHLAKKVIATAEVAP